MNVDNRRRLDCNEPSLLWRTWHDKCRNKSTTALVRISGSQPFLNALRTSNMRRNCS